MPKSYKHLIDSGGDSRNAEIMDFIQEKTTRETSLKTIVFFVLIAGASVFGQWDFYAVLTGLDEVPPNGSSAFASASLTLNPAQDRLTIHLTLFALDLDGAQTPDNPLDNITGLHIHSAPAGVNGPVVFGLIGINNDLNGDVLINPPAGTVFSAWDLLEGNNTTLAAQIENLFDGRLYINVHTVAYPGGEIRGQIHLIPEPATLALMVLGSVALSKLRRKTAASSHLNR